MKIILIINLFSLSKSNQKSTWERGMDKIEGVQKVSGNSHVASPWNVVTDHRL